MRRFAVPGLAALLVAAFAASAVAQQVTQRGFADVRGVVYPQTDGPDESHGGVDALFRYEPAWEPRPWLRVAGAFDARTDTRGQVES